MLGDSRAKSTGNSPNQVKLTGERKALRIAASQLARTLLVRRERLE